ncbi:MAG: hypothetical protein HQK84_02970 [Nitrospinae bacterium]|nr:hypothetical protein [Nitrospinota bacterium]
MRTVITTLAISFLFFAPRNLHAEENSQKFTVKCSEAAPLLESAYQKNDLELVEKIETFWNKKEIRFPEKQMSYSGTIYIRDEINGACTPDEDHAVKDVIAKFNKIAEVPLVVNDEQNTKEEQSWVSWTYDPNNKKEHLVDTDKNSSYGMPFEGQMMVYPESWKKTEKKQGKLKFGEKPLKDVYDPKKKPQWPDLTVKKSIKKEEVFVETRKKKVTRSFGKAPLKDVFNQDKQPEWIKLPPKKEEKFCPVLCNDTKSNPSIL